MSSKCVGAIATAATLTLFPCMAPAQSPATPPEPSATPSEPGDTTPPTDSPNVATELPVSPPAAEPPATPPPAPDAATPPSPAEPDAPAQPAAQLEDVDLMDLLEGRLRGNELGGTGNALEGVRIKPLVHGYLSAALEKEGEEPITFWFEDVGVMFGANIADLVQPEVLLALHPAESDVVTLRYARVDATIIPELLIVRAGQFLTPFGLEAEYFFADFVSIAPLADFSVFHDDLVPLRWTETGLQLRGRTKAGSLSLHYTLYAGNGLTQEDDPETPVVESGGGVKDFAFSAIDPNGDKAIGVRVGVAFPFGLQVDASGYTGAYTADGEERLTALSLDALLETGPIRSYVEAVAMFQTTPGDDLLKWGALFRLGVTVLPWLEPSIGLDFVDLDNDIERWSGTASLNVRPFPENARTLLVRLVGGATKPEEEDEDVELGTQLIFSAGF